jgi:hypothetical protein
MLSVIIPSVIVVSVILQIVLVLNFIVLSVMRFCQPPEGNTSPKYKLLCFITNNFFCKEKNSPAFNRDRCCHLVLCLPLIPLHCNECNYTWGNCTECICTECNCTECNFTECYCTECYFTVSQT